jgi:hypothetical protein
LELGDGNIQRPISEEELALALVPGEGEKEEVEGDEKMEELGTDAKESPIKIQDKKRLKKTGEEVSTTIMMDRRSLSKGTTESNDYLLLELPGGKLTLGSSIAPGSQGACDTRHPLSV